MGARLYIEKNATKIQSLLRRYYIRTKFFTKMLSENFQPSSILLKRELIAYKLSCASDNYTKA
jgi:hypothetical protein